MAGLSVLNTGCRTRSLSEIPGEIRFPNHPLGHLLRSHGPFPAVSSELTCDVLIIGGGISGLSARYALRKAGIQNQLLVELETECGGNARSGSIQGQAYPLGAHYLPIPDKQNTELIHFLKDIGCIQSFTEDGQPMYNPYYICHDPMERLFLDGRWMDGLVPSIGLSSEDKKQFAHFFSTIADLKSKVGSDGRPWFCFPLSHATKDAERILLDRITFYDWLKDQGFDSSLLLSYLDYCCKDDYGGLTSQVSAYAGLHYHAARKGSGLNLASDDVLVWPEGNDFLAKALRKDNEGIRSGFMAYDVRLNENSVDVYCTDAKQSMLIKANKVILAVPFEVRKRLTAGFEKNIVDLKLQHAPWVVTNILSKPLHQRSGVPLSWDNVALGSSSVGYVNAAHQQLSHVVNQHVLSHYWPLVEGSAQETRRMLLTLTRDQWLEKVFEELQPLHSDIREQTIHADVLIWAHGFVKPSVGLITGDQIQHARKPIENRVFFAHTDYSGISVFEEAFDQGVTAARQVLNHG